MKAICKHCGKDIDDHGFLSFRCPRYVNGIKLGYIDGVEFELVEENTNNNEIHIDLNAVTK